MTDRVAHPDKPVVAVLGGRGMLGTDLVAACAAGGFDVRSCDLPEFDITDAEHLRGVVEASDAMVKAARVDIADFRVVGSGLVAVVVSGDVAAVQAAVAAGESAAASVGQVVSCNVIARPSGEVAKLLE